MLLRGLVGSSNKKQRRFRAALLCYFAAPTPEKRANRIKGRCLPGSEAPGLG